MARRERIAAAVLFALAVAAFASAWRFPCIDIDDPYYYALPKEITGGLSWGGVKWAFTDLSNAIWMPLTWISYQIDYTIRNAVMAWNPSCDGFQLAYTIAHVQSILLHGLNAVLLFALLRRLGGGVNADAQDAKRTTASFIAAAVWAVHPLRVESVVWIASFKDVLSMFFLLLALIKWVDWRERGGVGRYALSHVAFVLACMAKPSVVTFPGMVFLLDALVLGKFNPLPLERSRYRAYAPSLAIAVPVAILAQIAQTAGGATAHQAGIPLWYRLLNALVSVGVYVRNFFWPSDLAPQCAIQWPGMPHFLAGGVAVGGAFVVLAAALAWMAWRRFRGCGGRGATALPGEVRGAYFSAGVLWFAGTILPMLGISAFGGHAFADRFTYVPAVGLSLTLMGAWSGAKAAVRNGRRTTASFVVATIAVAALLASSWRQTAFWRDDGALMQRILEVDGDGNYLAHVTYAKHLFDHGRSPEGLKEAEAHFTRGYELNPDYCQLSAICYLMLLGETGKTDGMDRVRDGFVRWLRERRGIWRCLDMDVAEGLVKLYMEDGRGIRHAHRIASELMRAGNIPAYQPYYFIYCVGVKSGDDAMRRYGIDGIRRLSDPRKGFDGWPSFRFILDGAGAGSHVDAGSRKMDAGGEVG